MSQQLDTHRTANTRKAVLITVGAIAVAAILLIAALIIKNNSSDDTAAQPDSKEVAAIRDLTQGYILSMGSGASLNGFHCANDSEESNTSDGRTYSLVEMTNIRVGEKSAYARVVYTGDDGRTRATYSTLLTYALQGQAWRLCNDPSATQALMNTHAKSANNDRPAIEAAFTRFLETFLGDNPRDKSAVCDQDWKYSYVARTPPVNTVKISNVQISGLDVDGDNAVLLATWTQNDSITGISNGDEVAMMKKSPDGKWQQCGRISHFNGVPH